MNYTTSITAEQTVMELLACIEDLCLGSCTWDVQDAAVRALIAHWNEHNPEQIIDEVQILEWWKKTHTQTNS